MLVPNGDRRYGAESGSVVDKENVFVRNDHVVGELVLGYNLGDDLRNKPSCAVRGRPRQYLVEAFVLVDLTRQFSEVVRC